VITASALQMLLLAMININTSKVTLSYYIHSSNIVH